jgi:hypothetical protein
MTVEHENLRMAAPEDLPDWQSRHHGADLMFGDSYKPISNDKPSSNNSKDLQDIICWRTGRGPEPCYNYLEHESFQRRNQEVPTQRSEE